MNRSARRGQRWLTPTAVLLTACAGGGDESSFGANVQTFSAIGGSGRFSRRVGRDRGATALTPGDVVVTRHQVSPLAATDVGNERPSRSAVYDHVAKTVLSREVHEFVPFLRGDLPVH